MTKRQTHIFLWLRLALMFAWLALAVSEMLLQRWLHAVACSLLSLVNAMCFRDLAMQLRRESDER